MNKGKGDEKKERKKDRKKKIKKHGRIHGQYQSRTDGHVIVPIKSRKKQINHLDKKMEKIEEKIVKYRESDLKSSPICVWFSRCGICNCAIQCKPELTTAMITHLEKCNSSVT